jgi:predicted DNA binding CopG/RHH family protein
MSKNVKRKTMKKFEIRRTTKSPELPSSEEQFFEDHFEEMKSLGPEVIAKVKARNDAAKDARINMRVNPEDLKLFKNLADEKRIPYQTLLSHVIHEYATGNLVNVKEIAKVFKKRAG